MPDPHTEGQAAADAIAALDDTSPDGLYRGTQGFSDRALAVGLTSLGGGGGSPLTITFTAAEIAPRWFSGDETAFMEWPAITTDTRALGFAVRANTLDNGGTETDHLYAYPPGATSAEVDLNGEPFVAEVFIAPSIDNYFAFETLPDTKVSRLLPGAAAYARVSGGPGPPTTGAITFELLAL